MLLSQVLLPEDHGLLGSAPWIGILTTKNAAGRVTGKRRQREGYTMEECQGLWNAARALNYTD